MMDCPYREEEPGGAASPEEALKTRERKEIETEEDKEREQREEQAPLPPTENSVERAKPANETLQTAAAILQQSTRCWLARCKYYELLGAQTMEEEEMACAEREASTADFIMQAEAAAARAATEMDAEVRESITSILGDLVQTAISVVDSKPTDKQGLAREVIHSLIDTAIEAGARNESRVRAAKEAWRALEAELEATAKREAEKAAAEEELAEQRRREEAERMALNRAATVVQKICRGGRARVFTRHLREMRLEQQKEIETEERKRARDAISTLKAGVPQQVHEFRMRFHAVIDDALDRYAKRSANVNMPSSEAAQEAMRAEIMALWSDVAIANERAIANALVNAARVEVRKGLVLGRVTKGAQDLGTLTKGLDRVETIAQEFLGAALRNHLPLEPETVEERMASLKISIQAKKTLQSFVQIECEKVRRDLAQLMRPKKKSEAEVSGLLGLIAGSEPGSVLHQWEPLAHSPGDLNRRVLHSRERATVKGSIRECSSFCQQRWQALSTNLDNARNAFTNSVLGISGGRGWDANKSSQMRTSLYSTELACAFSYVSEGARARGWDNDPRIMSRRISNLFGPKLEKQKPARNQFQAIVMGNQGQIDPGFKSTWPEWKPGRFRRSHLDSRYAEYCRKREPEFPHRPHSQPVFMTQIDSDQDTGDLDTGAPISPTELQRRNQLAAEWRSNSSRSARPSDSESKSVLPKIVNQNLNHVLSKLEKEIEFQRIIRDQRLIHQHPSRGFVMAREDRWQHIRQKVGMKTLPTKELFPTPRRVQRWRDRIKRVESAVLVKCNPNGDQGYAAGGRDSVLSMLSGDETRVHSRLTTTGELSRAHSRLTQTAAVDDNDENAANIVQNVDRSAPVTTDGARGEENAKTSFQASSQMTRTASEFVQGFVQDLLNTDFCHSRGGSTAERSGSSVSSRASAVQGSSSRAQPKLL